VLILAYETLFDVFLLIFSLLEGFMKMLLWINPFWITNFSKYHLSYNAIL